MHWIHVTICKLYLSQVYPNISDPLHPADPNAFQTQTVHQPRPVFPGDARIHAQVQTAERMRNVESTITVHSVVRFQIPLFLIL